MFCTTISTCTNLRYIFGLRIICSLRWHGSIDEMKSLNLNWMWQNWGRWLDNLKVAWSHYSGQHFLQEMAYVISIANGTWNCLIHLLADLFLCWINAFKMLFRFSLSWFVDLWKARTNLCIGKISRFFFSWRKHVKVEELNERFLYGTML